MIDQRVSLTDIFKRVKEFGNIKESKGDRTKYENYLKNLLISLDMEEEDLNNNLLSLEQYILQNQNQNELQLEKDVIIETNSDFNEGFMKDHYKYKSIYETRESELLAVLINDIIDSPYKLTPSKKYNKPNFFNYTIYEYHNSQNKLIESIEKIDDEMLKKNY